MESALSPNTAAFLQYISSQLGNEDTGNQQTNGDNFAYPQSTNIDQNLATAATSLPPSAFFQIPEPNNLPTPASKSVSPIDSKSVHNVGRSVSRSESEEGSPLRVGNASGSKPAINGAGLEHKRKAGVYHPVVEEDGDEEGEILRNVKLMYVD